MRSTFILGFTIFKISCWANGIVKTVLVPRAFSLPGRGREEALGTWMIFQKHVPFSFRFHQDADEIEQGSLHARVPKTNHIPCLYIKEPQMVSLWATDRLIGNAPDKF